MAIIGSHKRMLVYKKTDFKCAICGSTHTLDAVPFIPTWTRLPATEVSQLIPLCDECVKEVGINFIELGKLRYLPELYIEQLMNEYKHNSKYLRKYVHTYGSYRTGRKLDVDKALAVLGSYDNYIHDYWDYIDWDNL